jgi:hypothetical protein
MKGGGRKEDNMWYYKKVNGGYIRKRSIEDSNAFIFDMLANEINRSMWHKICQKVVCSLLGHRKSSICVAKGYIPKYGNFELVLCDRCMGKVVFYEGIIE